MKFLLFIPFAPLLISAGHLFWNWKAIHSEVRIFRWYLIFELTGQGISFLFFQLQINNLQLLYLYVPIGLFFIARFYGSILDRSPNSRLTLVVSSLFATYCLVDAWTGNILQFNAVPQTVQSMIVVIAALATFRFLLDKDLNNGQKNRSDLFWINLGFFMYYASSLILFYFGDVIMKRNFPWDIAWLAWLPHSFFSTVMYLCFFLGLWKNRKSSNLSIR